MTPTASAAAATLPCVQEANPAQCAGKRIALARQASDGVFRREWFIQ